MLYIEDPHPRAVRDANRARPDDLLPGLREAFARLDAAEPGERPSLAGVDAVRPVTFGYLPVLRRPRDRRRTGTGSATRCDKAGALGIDEYERVRDDLIERVIEAKLRRLATIDPASCTVAEWSSATHLDVMSMHDTMNHTARPDGAVCLERQPEDRLPAVVALSNHGDATGEIDPSDAADPAGPHRGADDAARAASAPSVAPTRSPSTPGAPTTSPTTARTRAATRPAPSARSSGASNRSPWCARAAASPAGSASACGRTSSSASSSSDPKPPPRSSQPGTDWVLPPDDRVDWLAGRLRHAHDLVRSWGTALVD